MHTVVFHVCCYHIPSYHFIHVTAMFLEEIVTNSDTGTTAQIFSYWSNYSTWSTASAIWRDDWQKSHYDSLLLVQSLTIFLTFSLSCDITCNILNRNIKEAPCVIKGTTNWSETFSPLTHCDLVTSWSTFISYNAIPKPMLTYGQHKERNSENLFQIFFFALTLRRIQL